MKHRQSRPDDTLAAQAWLYDCIQQLASRASNPVLAVLRDIHQVEQEHKYPEPGLAFGGLGLRAFYHCHAPDTADEHGHFHLFLHGGGDRESLTNWGHLAGLAMDTLGQPRRWFTVNRWVTGGPWWTAARYLTLLENLKMDSDLLLVEEWLLAMLAVYRAELAQLLIRRDQTLTQLMAGSNKQAILDDRSYYEFSTCAIDLLTKFQQHQ